MQTELAGKKKTKPVKKGKVNRRAELLQKAGELMADKGYEGASMRNIADAVGILPGSVYYHFESKEALFEELHRNIVAAMTQRVKDAVAEFTDPWDRLEAAACAHIEGLLETGNQVAIVSPGFARQPEGIESVVREERRTYEDIFRMLLDALDLPEGTDRTLMRLSLFGTLNWAPVWFQPGGTYKPSDIAHQHIGVLRRAYSG